MMSPVRFWVCQRMLDVAENGVAQPLHIALGGVRDEQPVGKGEKAFRQGARQHGGRRQSQMAAQRRAAAQRFQRVHQRPGQGKGLLTDDGIDSQTDDLGRQKAEQNGKKGRQHGQGKKAFQAFCIGPEIGQYFLLHETSRFFQIVLLTI